MPPTPAWPGRISMRSRRRRPGSRPRRRARRSPRSSRSSTAAESEERGLAAGEIDIVEGAVQILTVHAAKGLEWDVVAVAGLTQGHVPEPDRLRRPLPGRPRHAAVPAARRRGRAAGARLRRTRPRRSTYATRTTGFTRRLGGARRAGGAPPGVRRRRRGRGSCCCAPATGGRRRRRQPRGPSVFLEDVRRACETGAGAIDVWDRRRRPRRHEPDAGGGDSVRRWPADPLGRAAGDRSSARRPWCAPPTGRGPGGRRRGGGPLGVRGGSAAGRAGPSGPGPGDAVGTCRAGPAVGVASGRTAPRPGGAGPHACADRCRARPDPYARRGTAFHRWLEQRFGADQLLDLDELPGAGDENAAAD